VLFAPLALALAVAAPTSPRVFFSHIQGTDGAGRSAVSALEDAVLVEAARTGWASR
jgi:hypothetical protein